MNLGRTAGIRWTLCWIPPTPGTKKIYKRSLLQRRWQQLRNKFSKKS